jgi:hypothetical protein
MIEYFWREYIHYNIDISFKIDWSVFVYELVRKYANYGWNIA